MSEVSILVVEPHDMLREKIAGVVSRCPGVDFVSQLSDYSRLETVTARMRPEVLLMDLVVARICADCIEKVRRRLPDVHIVLFCDRTEPEYLGIARRIGFDDFVETTKVFEAVEQYIGNGRGDACYEPGLRSSAGESVYTEW